MRWLSTHRSVTGSYDGADFVNTTALFETKNLSLNLFENTLIEGNACKLATAYLTLILFCSKNFNTNFHSEPEKVMCIRKINSYTQNLINHRI